MYRRGGLISVTLVILIADLLNNDVPVHLITGLVFLHADR